MAPKLVISAASEFAFHKSKIEWGQDNLSLLQNCCQLLSVLVWLNEIFFVKVCHDRDKNFGAKFSVHDHRFWIRGMRHNLYKDI